MLDLVSYYLTCVNCYPKEGKVEKSTDNLFPRQVTHFTLYGPSKSCGY